MCWTPPGIRGWWNWSGVDGSGVGAMLLTAHVEGPALAAVGPLPVEETAGLLAALASTLADLHEPGLVHGAVRPST